VALERQNNKLRLGRSPINLDHRRCPSFGIAEALLAGTADLKQWKTKLQYEVTLFTHPGAAESAIPQDLSTPTLDLNDGERHDQQAAHRT
jgi:hypothetical protein